MYTVHMCNYYTYVYPRQCGGVRIFAVSIHLLAVHVGGGAVQQ